MKYIGIGIILVLVATGFTSNLNKENPPSKEKPEEQSFSILPDPANNYLEVKINYSRPETVKKTISSYIQVFNSEGVMVYNATKNVNQFSIFTGGLPEGEYKITCKIDTSMLKQSFRVKH